MEGLVASVYLVWSALLVLYWLWCMHGCVEPVMWQAQDGAGGRYAEAGELHGLVAGHGCMLAVLLVTVLLSLSF